MATTYPIDILNPEGTSVLQSGQLNFTDSTNAPTPGSGGIAAPTAVAPTGLTGATQVTRYVGGVATQNLVITAPIGGDSGTPLVWQGQLSGTAGSLFLYGNNTFSGGVDLDTSAALNFNNANSFGTGPIRWRFDTAGTQFALSAPALMYLIMGGLRCVRSLLRPGHSE